MDYRDIIKAISSGKSAPDLTSVISSITGNGSDMSSLLPVMLKAMQKGDANKVFTETASEIKPSDEDVNEALKKLSESEKTE